LTIGPVAAGKGDAYERGLQDAGRVALDYIDAVCTVSFMADLAKLAKRNSGGAS
jgi:hypothetical protein